MRLPSAMTVGVEVSLYLYFYWLLCQWILPMY